MGFGMRGIARGRAGPGAAVLVTVILAAAQASIAQEVPGTNGDRQTGEFTLSFKERSPFTKRETLSERLREAELSRVPAYEIAEERHFVYVPEGYDGSKPYGLMVYIDPGGKGRVPRPGWRNVLDEHKLIWVAPHGIGNERHVIQRIAIALDAAHNMQQRYAIDSQRVYITGLSGGGRCASWLGLLYPDVFDGMLPMCGVDYFTRLKVPGRTNTYWRQKFPRPRPGKLLVRMLKRSRHVLLTGSEDGNRLQTKATAEKMKDQRFEHVTYLEVPGMGHTWPPADWFEKAVRALDAPIRDAE